MRKRTPPNRPISNKIKLISVLIFIVVTAVTSAVIVSKTAFGPTITTTRDIGMASDVCEDRIISEYKKTLINKNYDDISSRYEPNNKQYIVYYRITLRSLVDDIPTVTAHLAKCIVWEKLGYVSSFEVIDI